MTINLPKDLEQFVHEAVRDGFYAREDDVTRDALTRLRQDMSATASPAKRSAKRIRTVPSQVKKPLSIEEIHQQMLASGLLAALPDPALDIDDDDPDDQPDPSRKDAHAKARLVDPPPLPPAPRRTV
jgi:Arc/MetJ-type ribon-helix-helix transcriptional regulator